MNHEKKQNYYEILDISLSANAEIIRTAYIRAKNAYNRDSLAAYSLFDPEESKQILEEIEEAYTVLSDSEKRRKYDESHGLLSSDSSYEDYTARDALRAQVAAVTQKPVSIFSEHNEHAEAPVSYPEPAPKPDQSAIERLQAAQTSLNASVPLKGTYSLTKSHVVDEAMEEKIRNTEPVTGAFLKSIREYRQVRPEEIMDSLKISKNYLAALEADDFSKLPATVFVRGFVIQYTKALKLDHEKLTASYMQFLKSKRP